MTRGRQFSGWQSKLRLFLKYAVVYCLYGCGALWLAKWWIRRKKAVVALVLHRVLPSDEFRSTNSLPGMVVSEGTFRALAAYLARQCTPVDLKDGVPRWNVACDLPRVLLTFDDGWADTANRAYPIAKAHGLPMTVFVCPGLAARRFPFWPERVVALSRAGALAGRAGNSDSRSEGSGSVLVASEFELVERMKRLPASERAVWIKTAGQGTDWAELLDGSEQSATMTWNDVALLAHGGVDIGSHTQTHEILTGIPLSRVRNEVTQSKRDLEARLGSCTSFAYPNGDYSPDAKYLVRCAGYQRAFTTQPGLWTADSDPLEIPRVNVSEQKLIGMRGRFSPAMFEYCCFWKAATRSLFAR